MLSFLEWMKNSNVVALKFAYIVKGIDREKVVTEKWYHVTKGIASFFNRSIIHEFVQSSFQTNLNIFIPPKKPRTHGSHSLFPPPSGLWKPIIYLLSLLSCLFWTFRIKDIIQYVAFGVRPLSPSVLSKLIHLIENYRTLFLLMANW